MLDGVPDEVKKIRGLLRIRFLFSLANVFFSLKRQGQSEWFQAGAFRISHQPQQGMAQYLIPVFQEAPPEALRIEASGLAGIGLTYAEFLGPGNERHVPCAVTVIGGRASNPEALLEDGADWCLLGDWEQEAGSKFLQPELAEIRHGVEIALRPADWILNDKPGDK